MQHKLPHGEGIFHCGIKNCEDAKIPRVGRCVDISREEAFLRVMDEFRENDDDEQTTVTDLVERMSSISPEPYSVKYMRQKLLTQLGDSVS